MKTEIELKLSLPKRAGARLARHALLANAPSKHLRIHDSYYDTSKLKLKQAQLALRLRKTGRQRIRTVKATPPEQAALAQRAEWEQSAKPGMWDFSDIDHPATKRLLENSSANLSPLFYTAFSRQTWLVSYRASVIELALDRGHILSEGRKREIAEVELELMQGEANDLFAFALDLQETLPLRLLFGNKAETGYQLYANTVATASKAVSLKLRPGMSAVAGFRLIALSCLNQILSNQDGIASDNPEFLHQTRVGLRRLRAALRLFSPVLPENFAREWNAIWRVTGQHFGEARNLDVFCTQILPRLEATFPDHPKIRLLRLQAEKLAHQLHKAVARHVASPEHARNLLRFASALWTLPETDSIDLASFSRRRLNKLQRRAHAIATQAAQLDTEGRHDLRIAFKKLRYPLEALTSILPSKRSKAYLAALSSLQEELGQMNDCANAQALLSTLLKPENFDLAEGWLAGKSAILLEHLPEKLEVWLEQKSFWK